MRPSSLKGQLKERFPPYTSQESLEEVAGSYLFTVLYWAKDYLERRGGGDLRS